jgi:hypothetical protein
VCSAPLLTRYQLIPSLFLVPKREDQHGICWLLIVVEGDIARVTKRDNQLTQPRLILKRSPNARLGCQQLKLAKNRLRSSATGSRVLLRKKLTTTLKAASSARCNN